LEGPPRQPLVWLRVSFTDGSCSRLDIRYDGLLPVDAHGQHSPFGRRRFSYQSTRRPVIHDTKQNDDRERRLRLLERWGWAARGGGWLAQLVLVAYLTFKRIHPTY
jgi:hypothetical protein